MLQMLKTWTHCQSTQPVHSLSSEHSHHRYFQLHKPHTSAQHQPYSPLVSAIEAYIQTLKTQGKDEAEVLQTLKLCYEDPLKNVASVELEDF